MPEMDLDEAMTVVLQQVLQQLVPQRQGRPAS